MTTSTTTEASALSKKTLIHAIRSGELVAERIKPGPYLVSPEALGDWIEAHAVRTPAFAARGNRQG